jgi:hypothetical protein
VPQSRATYHRHEGDQQRVPHWEGRNNMFIGLTNSRQLVLYAGVVVLVIIAIILARLRWRE